MTFRLRLLVTSLVTLAVGLSTLLVAGNILLAKRERSDNSTVLAADANAQVSALSVRGGHITVRSTPNDAVLDQRSWVFEGDRVLERPEGASRALNLAALALAAAGSSRSVEVDGPGDTRLRSEPVLASGSDRPVGTVVVALSLSSVEHLRKEVLAGSLVIALLVMLAGAAAIRGALRGALRPVAQMTASIEDWSAHDLDKRFDLGPARDELTGLAATLDVLLARIAASRRHEQRFASEVAHELRTPLTRLRLRAELALEAEGSEAEAEREQALQSVIEQAARLDQAIEALLAIARHEIDPSQGSVDLAAIARDVEGVEVSSPVDLPLAEGDADVVGRTIAPLVDNARRYARSSVRLELSSERGRVLLAVCDDGPGLDPDLGERAFDPGVRGDDGSDGVGLGLALALRLARSCGGDITIGDGPGGCFVLELPAVGRRD